MIIINRKWGERWIELSREKSGVSRCARVLVIDCRAVEGYWKETATIATATTTATEEYIVSNFRAGKNRTIEPTYHASIVHTHTHCPYNAILIVSDPCSLAVRKPKHIYRNTLNIPRTHSNNQNIDADKLIWNVIMKRLMPNRMNYGCCVFCSDCLVFFPRRYSLAESGNKCWPIKCKIGTVCVLEIWTN